jgi:chemotaxis protein MotB
MDMTYDELVASLEQEIEEKTIEIQRYENALTINIMDKIFFDSGKAVIKKDGYSVLDRIGGIVKDLPEKVIRIEGHTDDVPIGTKIKSKYPTNWELGAARASAVTRYLIDEQDIEPERMVAISYSKFRPIVPNITDEYRAKNRRIEIVLTDRSLYELMKVEEGVQ